jgi:hypothetical protein
LEITRGEGEVSHLPVSILQSIINRMVGRELVDVSHITHFD